MSNEYRDERDALRARSEGLEQELEEKRAEVEKLRAAAPAEHRLEQLASELAAAQAEIARMRQPPKLRSSKAVWISVIASIGASLAIAGAVTIVAMRSAATPTEDTPVKVVSVAPVEAPVDVPTAVAPPPPPPVKPTPTAAVEANSIKTIWKGKVKRAKGVDLAPGTPCEIAADLMVDAKQHVMKLTVVCGTHPLYSTADPFDGMSSTDWNINEEPVKDGFRRSIRYDDAGNSKGRNDVAIDTASNSARAWAGGAKPMEVELTVDELDAAQKEPLFGKSAAQPSSDEQRTTCKRFASAAKVVEVEGDTTVKKGASCSVTLRPATDQCQVNVTCGSKALYANGYAHVHGKAVSDDSFSTEDHDPKVHVEGTSAEVSDKGVTSWSVKLLLAHEVP